MNPNPLNYASLEASKRLQAAGIVIETEKIWHCAHGFFELQERGILNSSIGINYPAPSPAEVWRELSEGDYLFHKGMTLDGMRTSVGGKGTAVMNYNLADALIDLKIWTVQRKEKGIA
jgi:hypothetical protein